MGSNEEIIEKPEVSSNKKRTLTNTELIIRLGVVEVYDVQDASLFLKTSEDRIRHLVSQREIPHYKSETGRVYFKRKDLEDWRLKTRIPTMSEIRRQAEEYVTLNPR